MAKRDVPTAGKSLEQIYQKKTQLEHILLRPDSYIGSIQKATGHQWVLDSSGLLPRIVSRNIAYVPGLYKIFDEILVNAADNKQRDSSMTILKVTINDAANTVTIWNNGKGIPTAVHAEHRVHIPELIFGHLLTSSNYDDEEKKVVGGRNGYGAKLANIFSTEFTVETADSSRAQLYRQTWTGNMGTKGEPTMSKFSGPSDYTCVSFKPDLPRFKMETLDADTVALLSKRVYDMAGVLGKGVTVYLNGERLAISTFMDYVGLYAVVDSSAKVWERVNPRWEVAVTVSDGAFSQISFVNAICTTKGGQHVNYIADQIASAVVEAVVKKEKGKGIEVKPLHVRNYLSVFVNCMVENPAFDSQTKDTLTTRVKDFGSTAELSEKFLKQVLATGIVDRVLSFAKFKATAELQKAGGGKKNGGRLLDMPKLDDANWAGTAKGHECTLILTEGDSAKSLAIAGLSIVGRDRFGVFPLKGKLLNVREASHKSISSNVEIQNVVKIMGLQYGKAYDLDSVRGLRYGHLMIMSDQDHDGSHIKGLVLNFLHHFWPSLLGASSFLRQFITPIVKATKGKTEVSFFTLPEYHDWKDSQVKAAGGVSPAVALRGWSIKYYKGLGTSTSVEARAYFSALQQHALDFAMDVPEETGSNAHDLIDLAFSKKRADDRKVWLSGFVPGTHVDYDSKTMLVSDFINKELVLFSMADNVRSIPSVMDGMKPAQRKVLFACLKRNLKADIKVAQLAGYVSEHASYHHGEAALAATILGMAQDFVGANNLPLLVPSGQFGTRLQGGKDAASARYIFTRLSTLARALFHPDDDALLNYLDDDGQAIEPDFYLPVLPLALANGIEGIGTGWSTSIPSYNPRDLLKAVRSRINGEAIPALTPWFRGFNGTTEPKDASRSTFTVTGSATVQRVGDAHTLVVTELPVGRWTQDYKQFLVSLMTSPADREKEREKEAGKGPKGAKPAARAPSKATKGELAVAKVDVTAPKSRAAKGKGKHATTGEERSAIDDDVGEKDDIDDDFQLDSNGDDESEDADSDGGYNKRKGSKTKAKVAEEKDVIAALVPLDQPLVRDFTENHTDTTVHFTIRTTPAASALMETALIGADGEMSNAIRKVFRLDASISTTNMHLFDAGGRIVRYADPRHILETYFGYRLDAYERRKALLLSKLGDDASRLSNRSRFILAVISGDLVVSNRKRADLLAELHDAGYRGFEPTGEDAADTALGLEMVGTVGVSGSGVDMSALTRRYSYLLNMPMWSLTSERVAQLVAEVKEKETALSKLKTTSPSALWLADLNAVELALDAYDEEFAGNAAAASKAVAAGRKAAGGGRKAASNNASTADAARGTKRPKNKRPAVSDAEGASSDDGMLGGEGDSDEDFIVPAKKKRAVPHEKATSSKSMLMAAAAAAAPGRPESAFASARLSSLPVAAGALPSKPTMSTILIDLSDEEEGISMSLAQRLAMKAGAGAGAMAPAREPIAKKSQPGVPPVGGISSMEWDELVGGKTGKAAVVSRTKQTSGAQVPKSVGAVAKKTLQPGKVVAVRPRRRATAAKVSYKDDSEGSSDHDDAWDSDDDE